MIGNKDKIKLKGWLLEMLHMTVASADLLRRLRHMCIIGRICDLELQQTYCVDRSHMHYRKFTILKGILQGVGGISILRREMLHMTVASANLMHRLRHMCIIGRKDVGCYM
jgi:hypothetical protein